MASIDLTTCLKEVSAENPAGADLEYDPAFTEVFQQARGKPETQWSAAEEPNWREIRDRCAALLGQTKDLRLGLLLSLALIKTDGYEGFADGLSLLGAMLERYWPTLYPRLDPDDGDPTERVNVITALSPAQGTLGDTYRFRERLRDLPLVASPRAGRFSLRDIAVATGQAPAPTDGSPVPDERTIDAAFAEVPLENLTATHAAVTRAMEAMAEIEKQISSHVGDGRGESLGSLRQLLEEAAAVTGANLAKRSPAAETAAVGAAGASSQVRGGAPARGAPGTIASHQDVIEALDRICEYFQKNEPSSPIPLLLRRARRLVSKSFAEIVRDLSPDALGHLSVISGTDLTSEPAADGGS